MTWRDGVIADCIVHSVRAFSDDRGWLMELFRSDEAPGGLTPAMSYLSLTHPGVARGPHAHRDQSDLFAFFDGQFRVYLWDSRPGSPTEGVRQVLRVGRDNPITLVVPPGVVHAYRNISDADALIINSPDRLYGGPGRSDEVDEIRYEERPDSPYRLDP